MFPQAVSFQEAKYFAGPLPEPQTLFEYNQVDPTAADRIIGMAEREAQHRHETERALLRIHGRNSTLGVISATFLGSLAIGGGAYGMIQGADLGGAGLALAGLASLLTIFITQHRRSKEGE